MNVIVIKKTIEAITSTNIPICTFYPPKEAVCKDQN